MSTPETTALTVRGEREIVLPRSMDEFIKLAEKLAESKLLPEELRGKVPEVLMQMLSGQELGLTPMTSLRSFHIIKGRPVMSSDAMVAIVLGSGKAEYFRRVEATDRSVTYATKRRGETEQRCTWTMDMARTAGLATKDNWRAHPRQMLASRCKTELARDVYPDVLAGCMELDETTTLSGSSVPFTAEVMAHNLTKSASRQRTREPDAQDAEFVDQPYDPRVEEFEGKITRAADVAELKRIATEIVAANLAKPDGAYLNEVYKARMAQLRSKPAPVAIPVVKDELTEPTSTAQEEREFIESLRPDPVI